MKSSGLFNCGTRVKQEPRDVYESTDDVQCFRFQQENTERLRKCDENHEIQLDDLKIEFECRDEKPTLNSLVKIEDDSQNYSQGVEYSSDWATTNGIKQEILDKVKKEFFEDVVDN
ncbi:uncharacterized protein LOC106649254 isoform X2 [Trichogramma pretiosum]|uniref:uncharacterized protein LOC106649254 isoform X2 n=1 Tax=Trichogramma pretiosum TaxID=7493 RepID=UPI000C71BF39|nr:uncharacterized protein LOC106649254 isoform X2 [Trichogramma pretiosum]